MSNFSEKTQFDFLFDSLVQKYPGIQNGNRQNINTMFQFVTTPIAAKWVLGTDAEAYSLANAVPLNLDGFYVAGEALDRSYKSFVRSIKPTSTDLNDRYRQLTQILNNINSALNAKVAEAQSAYNVWAANNTDPKTGTAPKSFDTWITDRFGGVAYFNAIMDYEKQRDVYIKEQANILGAMGDPLQEALDLIDPVKQHSMNISQAGQPANSVPFVSISGNLAEDKLEWSRRREGDFDLDTTINARSVLTSEWVTAKETKIEKSCFRTSTTTTINTTRIITDINYNLRFKIVGLGSYNITRGNWFLPALVNPKMEIVEGSSFTNDTFFGNDGCLHLLPENLLVMYRPSFELTISTKCFKQEFGSYTDTKFDWFEIFGFRVDLGPSGKLQPIDQGETTKIVFNSPAIDFPQIVGVTSKLVYNGR